MPKKEEAIYSSQSTFMTCCCDSPTFSLLFVFSTEQGLSVDAPSVTAAAH